MMIGTMQQAGLYPPIYLTRPRLEREAVLTTLLNQNRPSVWQQVVNYIDKYGDIGNAQVRYLLATEDTLSVSKLLKGWVEQGVLVVANPEAGRNVRRYTLPGAELPGFFSNPDGKETY